MNNNDTWISTSNTRLDGETRYQQQNNDNNNNNNEKRTWGEWGEAFRLSVVHASGLNELLHGSIAYGKPFLNTAGHALRGLTDEERQYDPFNHWFFDDPTNAQYANLFVGVTNDTERDAMIQYASEYREGLDYIAKKGDFGTTLLAGLGSIENIALLLLTPIRGSVVVTEGMILALGGGATNQLVDNQFRQFTAPSMTAEDQAVAVAYMAGASSLLYAAARGVDAGLKTVFRRPEAVWTHPDTPETGPFEGWSNPQTHEYFRASKTPVNTDTVHTVRTVRPTVGSVYPTGDLHVDTSVLGEKGLIKGGFFDKWTPAEAEGYARGFGDNLTRPNQQHARKLFKTSQANERANAQRVGDVSETGFLILDNAHMDGSHRVVGGYFDGWQVRDASNYLKQTGAERTYRYDKSKAPPFNAASQDKTLVQYGLSSAEVDEFLVLRQTSRKQQPTELEQRRITAENTINVLLNVPSTHVVPVTMNAQGTITFNSANRQVIRNELTDVGGVAQVNSNFANNNGLTVWINPSRQRTDNRIAAGNNNNYEFGRDIWRFNNAITTYWSDFVLSGALSKSYTVRAVTHTLFENNFITNHVANGGVTEVAASSVIKKDRLITNKILNESISRYQTAVQHKQENDPRFTALYSDNIAMKMIQQTSDQIGAMAKKARDLTRFYLGASERLGAVSKTREDSSFTMAQYAEAITRIILDVDDTLPHIPHEYMNAVLGSAEEITKDTKKYFKMLQDLGVKIDGRELEATENWLQRKWLPELLIDPINHETLAQIIAKNHAKHAIEQITKLRDIVGEIILQRQAKKNKTHTSAEQKKIDELNDKIEKHLEFLKGDKAIKKGRKLATAIKEMKPSTEELDVLLAGANHYDATLRHKAEKGVVIYGESKDYIDFIQTNVFDLHLGMVRTDGSVLRVKQALEASEFGSYDGVLKSLAAVRDNAWAVEAKKITDPALNKKLNEILTSVRNLPQDQLPAFIEHHKRRELKNHPTFLQLVRDYRHDKAQIDDQIKQVIDRYTNREGKMQKVARSASAFIASNTLQKVPLSMPMDMAQVAVNHGILDTAKVMMGGLQRRIKAVTDGEGWNRYDPTGHYIQLYVLHTGETTSRLKESAVGADKFAFGTSGDGMIASAIMTTADVANRVSGTTILNEHSMVFTARVAMNTILEAAEVVGTGGKMTVETALHMRRLSLSEATLDRIYQAWKAHGSEVEPTFLDFGSDLKISNAQSWDADLSTQFSIAVRKAVDYSVFNEDIGIQSKLFMLNDVTRFFGLILSYQSHISSKLFLPVTQMLLMGRYQQFLIGSAALVIGGEFTADLKKYFYKHFTKGVYGWDEGERPLSKHAADALLEANLFGGYGKFSEMVMLGIDAQEQSGHIRMENIVQKVAGIPVNKALRTVQHARQATAGKTAKQRVKGIRSLTAWIPLQGNLLLQPLQTQIQDQLAKPDGDSEAD